MSVPRVEQQWETLYPDLDVDKPLEISKIERDPPVIQVPVRPRSKLPESIVKLPRASSQQYGPAFASMGYSSQGVTLKSTYLRTSNNCDNIHPANMMACDAQVGVDTLELCEYDMDEQDTAFLGFIITEYQTFLTAEMFEYLMSVLELEMTKLELRLPMQPLDVPDEVRACAVCADTEGQNLNAIIFCDGCDLAVHQDCYGVPFIPDGQWLCRQCQAHRGEPVSCQFCPFTSGAFKQLQPEHTWGHVLCAIWIPELHILNPTIMEPIEGNANIPKDRWRLKCSICHQKGGACIQCYHGDCSVAFHATCAQAAGLYMKMRFGILGAVHDPHTLDVYCPEHTPDGWKKNVNLQAATNILEEERAARVKALNTKNQYPYWRTSQGTMIIPLLISNALPGYLKDRFGVNVSPEVITRICRYWVLKREKTVSPFSRRLRTIIDASRHDELAAKDQLPMNRTRKRQLETLLAVIDEFETNISDETESDSNIRVDHIGTSCALTPPLSPSIKVQRTDILISESVSVPKVTQTGEVVTAPPEEPHDEGLKYAKNLPPTFDGDQRPGAETKPKEVVESTSNISTIEAVPHGAPTKKAGSSATPQKKQVKQAVKSLEHSPAPGDPKTNRKSSRRASLNSRYNSVDIAHQ